MPEGSRTLRLGELVPSNTFSSLPAFRFSTVRDSRGAALGRSSSRSVMRTALVHPPGAANHRPKGLAGGRAGEGPAWDRRLALPRDPRNVRSGDAWPTIRRASRLLTSSASGAHARQRLRRPVGWDAMQLAMRWLAVAIVFPGPGRSGLAGRLLRRRRPAPHFPTTGGSDAACDVPRRERRACLLRARPREQHRGDLPHGARRRGSDTADRPERGGLERMSLVVGGRAPDLLRQP